MAESSHIPAVLKRRQHYRRYGLTSMGCLFYQLTG
jgi:hypothetical protein